jgi:threonine dehydrogenase-like Zn-dependent dehydrogenase
MPETMRAIRLTGPVDSDGLTVSDVPIPGVRPGWVRIRVMAFGVNESEVTSRKGESDPEFTFPRILGIEGSRRRESHPPALAEPGVNVSAHRAPIVQPLGCRGYNRMLWTALRRRAAYLPG